MRIGGVGMALLLTAASKYLGPHRPTKAKAIAYEAAQCFQTDGEVSVCCATVGATSSPSAA